MELIRGCLKEDGSLLFWKVVNNALLLTILKRLLLFLSWSFFQIFNMDRMNYKAVAFILLLVVNYKCFSQLKTKESLFVINGRINEVNGEKIYLRYLNCEGRYIQDSAVVLHSRFLFSGCIYEPTPATLVRSKTIFSVDDPNYTNLYLEPGRLTVAIHVNEFKKLKVSGSKTQKKSELLSKRKTPITKRIDSTYQLILKNRESLSTIKDTDQIRQKNERISSLTEILSDMQLEIAALEVEFIRQNVTSYLSSELLFYNLERLSLDTIQQLYSNLSSSVKKSRFGINVFEEITKKENSLIGSMAPDFSVNDVNQSSLTLSSFRKKNYVLLDFWASWCIPCRESFPHLKELYKKYSSSGFEIIGISQDIDQNSWRQAILRDSLTIWKQCLIAEDLQSTYKGVKNPNDIIHKYYIPSIPVKILINKEGVIIGRWQGQSKENELSLDQLLRNIMGF